MDVPAASWRTGAQIERGFSKLALKKSQNVQEKGSRIERMER